MTWRRTAIIGNVFLFIIVVRGAFIWTENVIGKTDDISAAEKQSDEMVKLCGQSFGAGAVITWGVAYRLRKHTGK